MKIRDLSVQMLADIVLAKRDYDVTIQGISPDDFGLNFDKIIAEDVARGRKGGLASAASDVITDARLRAKELGDTRQIQFLEERVGISFETLSATFAETLQTILGRGTVQDRLEHDVLRAHIDELEGAKKVDEAELHRLYAILENGL